MPWILITFRILILLTDWLIDWYEDGDYDSSEADNDDSFEKIIEYLLFVL